MKVVTEIANYKTLYRIYELGNASYIIKFTRINGGWTHINMIFPSLSDALDYIKSMRIIDKAISRI